MAIENEEKKLNRKLSFHTIQNYAMGLLWLALGIVLMFIKELKFQDKVLDPVWMKIFGSACILYGLFRIYRGYKNKF
jgi:hypothetical protein